MDQAQQDALREPFEAHQIGKLPRGGIELDYVGHAAVTDRLLKVDPEWNWEPVAFGADGLPLVNKDGLWIKLTIAGVTRYGFGDQSNGKGMKEMIGDAIRNAAMRFGVALDLWSKQPLLDAGDEVRPSTPDRPARGRTSPEHVPTPESRSVPSTWKDLLDLYNERFYRHPWPEWWAEAAAATYGLRIETDTPFNGVIAAVKAEKGEETVKDFWVRLNKVADTIPTSDLGPVRVDVRQAFAEHFDGAVLFGPHVSMSPNEAEVYPTFDMYVAGDLRPAIQAAADQESGAESGPSDTAPPEEPDVPSDVTAGAGLGEEEPAPSAPENFPIPESVKEGKEDE